MWDDKDIPSLIIRILDLLQLMFHCKRNLHMIENIFQCEVRVQEILHSTELHNWQNHS